MFSIKRILPEIVLYIIEVTMYEAGLRMSD